MELESCRQIFEKILKYKISWKFVPWDASSMWQTDMEPLFYFRSFANASDKRVPHFRRRLISLFVSGDVMDSRFLPDTFQRTWSTLLHIDRGKMFHCWVGVDWAGISCFIPAVYFPLMPCGLRHLACSVVITTNIWDTDWLVG